MVYIRRGLPACYSPCHTVLGVPLDIIAAVVEVESLVRKISEIILNLNLIQTQPQDLEHWTHSNTAGSTE